MASDRQHGGLADGALGLAWSVVCAALIAGAPVAAAAEQWEQVPRFRASSVLPPDLRQGPGWVVEEDVGSDGQLEGLGAQLFSRVEGDFFSILGLPLLPLLDFLRGNGAAARRPS